MTETEIYSELSKRFIQAAKNNVNIINEAACFESYHAFESLAGAFNSYIGVSVNNKHKQKLKDFAINYKRKKISPIKTDTISNLVIKLSNLRNNCLYPISNNKGGYASPKDIMTCAQLKKLISQIDGVINKIVEEIK